MKPLALVADDNKVCLTVGVALLQQLGFNVLKANNGREAVEVCMANPISVILMDCDMPELDGLQATAYIREFYQRNDVLIVALTGEEVRENCLASGMDEYVKKPISRKILEDILEKWGQLPPVFRTEGGCYHGQQHGAESRSIQALQTHRWLSLQCNDLKLQQRKLEHLYLRLRMEWSTGCKGSYESRRLAAKEKKLAETLARLEKARA